MSDPSPTAEAVSPATRVCDEIGRAVGSLWQRRDGVRPESVETEYMDNVVRCTIASGGEDAESGTLGALTYQRLAKVAVADLTGRTVTGFVAKPSKGGGPVTNAFILEPVRTRH